MAGPGAAPATHPEGAAPRGPGTRDQRDCLGARLGPPRGQSLLRAVARPPLGPSGSQLPRAAAALQAVWSRRPRPDPSPGRGSARSLPCLRTNRPPGGAHVTPPPALRPPRKPEAAAAGGGPGAGGRGGAGEGSTAGPRGAASSPSWTPRARAGVGDVVAQVQRGSRLLLSNHESRPRAAGPLMGSPNRGPSISSCQSLSTSLANSTPPSRAPAPEAPELSPELSPPCRSPLSPGAEPSAAGVGFPSTYGLHPPLPVEELLLSPQLRLHPQHRSL